MGKREKKKKHFLLLSQEMGANSKWWSPTPRLILESWGDAHGQRQWIWLLRCLPKQDEVHPGPLKSETKGVI
jgi:hypothetical protein